MFLADMIRVYTKARHIEKIHRFLNSSKLEHEIFTTINPPSKERELEQFELGVSYCYPRKVTEPLLSLPPKGFINYHPGPLPKYKGPKESTDAINNKETNIEKLEKKNGISTNFFTTIIFKKL